MAYTLLKMVQLILSSMDSDEVNSIDDTVESQQVVDIIETTFNDLISTIGFPEQWDLFHLEASGDPSKPTLMRIPDDIMKFEWLQYDTGEDGKRNMITLSPLVRFEFLNRMSQYDDTDATVYSYDYSVDGQDFNIRGKNTSFPTYYTVLADKTVILDNYKADVDTTLVSSRSLGYGKKALVFTRDNTYVAPFDEQNWSIFFNEAKSQCFIDLKQVQNAKADQRARQAKIATQNNKARDPQVPMLYQTPDYGRRGAGRRTTRSGN